MGDTAAITAGAQATSGVAGAYSTYQSGRYNAKVDIYNAKVADLESQDAIYRGEQQVRTHQAQVARLKGAQRAAAAAQGIVVDQGSAADIADDTDSQAARDERQIRVNAALEAWGYQVQGVDYRARATMARYSANNDAAGSLLTTVARFNDTAYKSGWYDKKAPSTPKPNAAGGYGTRPYGPPAPAGTYDPSLPVY
jgi:hypothetical protein